MRIETRADVDKATTDNGAALVRCGEQGVMGGERWRDHLDGDLEYNY